MRVLQIIPDFGLGGIQKAGCVLGAAMARQGHETLVAALGSGPRFQAQPGDRQQHRVVPDRNGLYDVIEAHNPDVIHLHDHAYCESIVHHIASTWPHVLIVSTPVFGRPPIDRSILRKSHTVCVGLYTFYRLCRWLGKPGDQALRDGIAYVPLTPLEPAPVSASANDEGNTLRTRRSSLGINPAHDVVGRIGRNDPAKWHPQNEHVITALLEAVPSLTWVSVGYPEARGLGRLETQWGARFHNFAETADSSRLATILSSMDLQLFLSCAGECFSSTICEAAGVGVPTVALAMPLKDNGQAEQVIAGVTGILAGSADSVISGAISLLSNPAELKNLKLHTESYARKRWHADRVANDLLSLYEWWLGRTTTPSYFGVMVAEYDGFADRYRHDAARLMARNAASRLFWQAALISAESWSLFRIGRGIKRLREAPLPQVHP